MPNAERGAKHVCPDCACKFYDMKAETVACPKCGGTPAPVQLPRRRAHVRKSVNPAFRR
jgi:uncharacterized protein (TIGR02300 family)